ncbi:MAG TPA: hypothetical protein VK968_16975, partial [Roseimicrobium sp.]|nr:hypothetical protein [Roseimicrobium sp.]
MKKLISFSALTLAGVVFTVSIYFCAFFYNRYHNGVTELEVRINSFDMRLDKLEGHKAKGFNVSHVWGMISTTD